MAARCSSESRSGGQAGVNEIVSISQSREPFIYVCTVPKRHTMNIPHTIYIFCWVCGSKRRQLYYCGFLRDCFSGYSHSWREHIYAVFTTSVTQERSCITNQIKLWLLVWWNIKVLDEPTAQCIYKFIYIETFQLKHMCNQGHCVLIL